MLSTAFQPLYGQMANIFGRRSLMIIGMSIFLLGSGICGGSTSMSMLIAGRAIQGVGGAALMVLVDVIVCDMVPLRERGAVVGFLFVFGTLGTSLGPFVGGVFVARVTWRWVFWLNLPIGALALLLLVLFLHLRYAREPNLEVKVRRIDFVGNALFVLAVIAIQIPLADAGVTQPWASWQTILPLVLGILGLVGFVRYEFFSPLCREPTLPRTLFGNRTSATAFAISFIGNFLLYWTLYFLPIYFQAVLGATPTMAGVRLLPLVVFMPVAGIAGGAVLAKLGFYRPIHVVSYALMAIGLGTFILLDARSPTAMWASLQIIFAIGQGCTMSTLLPAIQAPLTEAETATTSSTYATVRSFGAIVAIAVSTSIFNQKSAALAAVAVSDPTVRSAFENGHAYELATAAFVGSFQDQLPLQAAIIEIYTYSLQLVWEVAAAFAGVALLMVFLEREIPLRTELETQFAMDES